MRGRGICTALLAVVLGAAAAPAAEKPAGIGEAVVRQRWGVSVDTLERFGREAMEHCNIRAARLFLLPAALIGHPEAARMVAQTYDPGWLSRAGFDKASIVALTDFDRGSFWWVRAARMHDPVAMRHFLDGPG